MTSSRDSTRPQPRPRRAGADSETTCHFAGENAFDPQYRRLRFCRYADDLIGIIGSKAEAEEVKQEVTTFLREHLALTASPEKSKVSKASEGTVFLGYHVCTVSGGRTTRVRFQGRYTRARAASDRIHLLVPPERWCALTDARVTAI